VKLTIKTFSLIPSDRTKSDIATPMSVLSAVPLVFPTLGNLSTLGLIDTGAAVSCISETHVQKQLPERIIEVRTVGGNVAVPMLTMDILLTGPDFRPWLHLQRVPFAVLPRRQWLSEAAGARLGYSGCLEYLTVHFNFPKREVSISAPEGLSAGYSKEDESVESSRLREARVLLEIGSYDSAIIMAAAALEEWARLNLPFNLSEIKALPLERLRRFLPRSLHSSLESVIHHRNRAVHKLGDPAGGAERAKQIIGYSQKILQELSKQAPSTKP
jgi:hypothetical protein